MAKQFLIADPFQSIAGNYVQHRPHYPKELFDYLSSLCAAHENTWDCATGNGQVAYALTHYFDHIIATDRSAGMLKQAMQHPKIEYREAKAEDSKLPSNHFDLVTVGTALHWLDAEKFFAETNRVLKPGGVIAAWGYRETRIEPAIDALSDEFYFRTLRDYWASDMDYIWSDFTTKPFPFQDIKPPTFDLLLDWKFDQFFSYLKTFSALEEFHKRNGYDALDAIKDKLQAAWGNPDEVKKVRWSMALRIGRKN